jgi:hypothetical protein
MAIRTGVRLDHYQVCKARRALEHYPAERLILKESDILGVIEGKTRATAKAA